MDLGWPMFSENTLMLHQQDLQLGPYFVKWQLVINRGWPKIPIYHFAKYLQLPKFLWFLFLNQFSFLTGMSKIPRFLISEN